jgi:MFS transporter, ACS family, D-galactonate transporter
MIGVTKRGFKGMGKKRWGIATLLSIGIMINYFDRINISVATKPMSQYFHLTPGQMGIILSAFAWSYTICQLPMGSLLDKIGIKWVMRVCTVLMSVVTFLTAIAGGMGLVLLSRLMLGVVESPAFVSTTKANGYWFPRKELGLASSIVEAGSRVASAIGVPIVAYAITKWGWTGGFYLSGILTLIFALAYWIFYREPEEDKHLSKPEYEYIIEGRSQEVGKAPGGLIKNIRFLLKQRKVWGLIIGFGVYGYPFQFFLTWLPGYLQMQMHMTILKSGWYTVVPWIVGTLTNIIFGGWLVDHLIKRGFDPVRVRKIFFSVGMIFGLAVFGAAFTNNPNVAIMWIAIALGGMCVSAPIGWSIPALIAPKGTVGTLAGLMAFVQQGFGMLAPMVTGFIVGATGTFADAFIVAGVFLFIGIIAFGILLNDMDQIESPFTKMELGKLGQVANASSRRMH